MKILNLYSGIGGNRKLWGNEHEITAIELDPKIAAIYQYLFPRDIVISADAHKYLLEHFEEYDFIWSSPPCPSHSRIRRYLAVGRGQNKPIYPDMKLYEEILLLQNYYKGNYCVENVIGFYKPLIAPQEIANHYFWANFFIHPYKERGREHNAKIGILEERKGFNLDKFKKVGIEKKLLLRNCVEPELGLHIFEEMKRQHKTLL